jgi:hypothetical protein
MPGVIPDKIWLYRITHRDNLPHILQHGLVTAEHQDSNPDFVSIGNRTLIEVRSEKKVTVPPYGHLSDYIPFYLGPHSPMLLQIITGRGVPKRTQEEIIYLISSLDSLKAFNCQYCFTDGHARDGMTSFYFRDEDFDKIDWNMVKQKQWADREEDYDRQRRKQAEVLVHDKVPVEALEAIVVKGEETFNFAQQQVTLANLAIKVLISPKHYY